jgi:hypothetical protein
MKAVLLVVCICTISACGQKPSTCLSIGGVINELKARSFVQPNVDRQERYSKFDLVKFEPIPGEGHSPNDYFICGFDKHNECWSVEHFERAPRLSNFKMNRYEFDQFNAYTLQRSGQEDSFLPVFFIVPKGGSEASMINVAEQFGDSHHGMNLFDEVPVGSIRSLSAIMTLGADFFPTSLVRFHNATPVYGSRIFYENGTTYIENERIFVFWKLGDSQAIQPLEDRCLQEIGDAFLGDFELVFAAEPDIPHPNRFMPLWVMGRGTRLHEIGCSLYMRDDRQYEPF